MKNLCDTCKHNVASEKDKSLDCECVCSGVEKIEDDGAIVAKCTDYVAD